MTKPIKNNTSIKLGFVPSHLILADTHIPNEKGELPRDEMGSLLLLKGIVDTCSSSPVQIDAIQIMYFPGISDHDSQELINGVQEIGVEPQLIFMVGGADPMSPADEDAVAELLLSGIEVAKRHGIKHIGSTSVEAWMASPPPADEADFEQRKQQIIKLHERVFTDGKMAESSIESWHLEFLRPGEMNTFTSIPSVQSVVAKLNEKLGLPFFKVLVDAAHCGDGDLTQEENAKLIHQLAGDGQFEVFHASAPTTRGCVSSDECWISSLLAAAAISGALKYVIVEVFHHADPALQALREYDPNHGIDTSCGRTYQEIVHHNLTDIALRLNNLKNRKLID
ncbi:hypothetical protein N9A94_00140 [Akkermansiaceae bacterium]|nr:hypothetical protein [Akkermansiaceae bacterium]MDB4537733.1 hypothetical protein [Akkermansiaceae bacterium]